MEEIEYENYPEECIEDDDEELFWSDECWPEDYIFTS
jgi:hypothetical protein